MNNDQVSSVFWFFIGLLFACFSVPYGIGTLTSPGTGFFPFLMGLIICIISSSGFLHATIENRQGKKWRSIFQGSRWQRPLISLAALTVYALLLEKLGFLLDTALLLGFLLRAIQPQKWLVVVVGAILTSAVMYLIFNVFLQTQLPQGLLNF